jgi:prepilin-type processing-associated H-X9-DG protein
MARHGDGTNFASADGHSDYWKGKDVRTLEIAEMDVNEWQNVAGLTHVAISLGNEDLHRVQRGVFGSLGYGPARCEAGVCPLTQVQRKPKLPSLTYTQQADIAGKLGLNLT